MASPRGSQVLCKFVVNITVGVISDPCIAKMYLVVGVLRDPCIAVLRDCVAITAISAQDVVFPSPS